LKSITFVWRGNVDGNVKVKCAPGEQRAPVFSSFVTI